MGIASYIKVIGRGREGARALSRDQAYDLMSQVLDGKVTDLEVGAFAVAMRIKGETVAELSGFFDAVRERCIDVTLARPAVVLPSYNGSRKVPNLTPLLAMLLAQHEVPGLVHGPSRDAARVTSAEIFRDLGLTCARDAGDIEAAWGRHEPAFICTDALCPPLSRLLAVRAVVGLRNPGHTVAKLLGTFAGAPTLRVVNYTHPEYGELLARFLEATAANAMLMRGTEGEPAADARRLQKLEIFVAGRSRPELSVPAQGGVLASAPVLPPGNDASTTASTIQAIVSGAIPAPAPLAAQTACLLHAMATMPAGAPDVTSPVSATQ
jgi:anthranilate phosphoribosyltransferase